MTKSSDSRDGERSKESDKCLKEWTCQGIITECSGHARMDSVRRLREGEERVTVGVGLSDDPAYDSFSQRHGGGVLSCAVLFTPAFTSS